jgi:hypothetical protein
MGGAVAFVNFPESCRWAARSLDAPAATGLAIGRRTSPAAGVAQGQPELIQVNEGNNVPIDIPREQ